MSAYKKGSKHKTKMGGDSSSLSSINPALFKELESLIQGLKNSQRCYADAASLVNSSELRNFFEKVELERTVFMEKMAISIDRLELISGKRSHGADVVWFSSVEVNNVSKEEFDLGVLSRCMQCEEVIHQAYNSAIRLREDDKIFTFLDNQFASLQRASQQLNRLSNQFNNKAY